MPLFLATLIFAISLSLLPYTEPDTKLCDEGDGESLKMRRRQNGYGLRSEVMVGSGGVNGRVLGESRLSEVSHTFGFWDLAAIVG